MKLTREEKRKWIMNETAFPTWADLAEEFDMTLIGFLRDEGFTLYTDSDRIRR